ncbi:uncharacterized protein LOC107420416 isoform X2 [Ziziphus jujuba]|uniref:Uncharacterized protein LOC107420416 isoform X2 n=1 Tax=Ziziphus jujuba TaxID=326968 RepID=A0A6P4A9Q2_ZIZJJ|nr:uncharacterized protein LOC107420416 isoform X2 [Ziziphus jujuba]
MTQMGRFLREWPMLHGQYSISAAFHRLLSSPTISLTPKATVRRRFMSTTVHSANNHRNVHSRSSGLRLPNAPTPSDDKGSSYSDSDEQRSRNQLKRQARRAVRWGMELASFSTPQIKRILRAASLDNDVFEALVLVKKLGRDVREGKRRQFNYIGKLLRDVEPELMDALIQATKDGDQNKLQGLCGPETLIIQDDDEEFEETDAEEEEEGSHNDIATRWFDGLVNKDVEITNEVYSIHDVEFDRQELRKLVRRVHSVEEHKVAAEENKGEIDAAVVRARRSLTRFLHAIAKQISTA